MLPLGSIIQKYEMNYHLYADDIQLYISVEPRDTVVIERLSNCLSSIVKWMNANFLKLNKDKTEILIVGKKPERERIEAELGSLALQSMKEVKNLGVTLDCDLSFKSHINRYKNMFLSFEKYCQDSSFFIFNDAKKLIHVFICVYCVYWSA